MLCSCESPLGPRRRIAFSVGIKNVKVQRSRARLTNAPVTLKSKEILISACGLALLVGLDM